MTTPRPPRVPPEGGRRGRGEERPPGTAGRIMRGLPAVNGQGEPEAEAEADLGAGWPSGPGLDGEERPPEEEERPSTWRRVDLGPVLDGTWARPVPTVGRRDDGAGLFYPGRLHVVAAEAEAGKTWFALAAVATELHLGHGCLFIDFEDDAGGVGGRLLAIGSPPAEIRDRFGYIRPDEPIGLNGNRADLAEALGDLKPSLVILDGITEAMGQNGLELRDNTDVAKFGRLLPGWIAKQGPAVVALDHVVKDRERRDGLPIGGVHKLNGLNGALYLLENREPFGIGITGRSRLLGRKDRPGQLRRLGVPWRESVFYYADLVIRSHAEPAEFAEVSLPVAEPRADERAGPTVLMSRVAAVLAAAPAGLGRNAIVREVTGKAEGIRWAIDVLIDHGHVAVEQDGQKLVCKLIKPYAAP